MSPICLKERCEIFLATKINRISIFTPNEMFGFYKEHIEYITEHAVDPDKEDML